MPWKRRPAGARATSPSQAPQPTAVTGAGREHRARNGAAKPPSPRSKARFGPSTARELLVLPRIALDNNPATLVRALMLGSDAPAYALAELRGKGAA